MAKLGTVRTDPGAMKCQVNGCGADVTAVIELKATPLEHESDDVVYFGIESNIIALEGCEHAEAWEPE